MAQQLSVISLALLLFALATSPTSGVGYKGRYLCNWLVKLEDFFLCHSDKVLKRAMEAVSEIVGPHYIVIKSLF